jgi:hypothetical protein
MKGRPVYHRFESVARIRARIRGRRIRKSALEENNGLQATGGRLKAISGGMYRRRLEQAARWLACGFAVATTERPLYL